jgi:hypothetical protein
MLIKTKDFQLTPQALLFDPEYYIFDFVPENDLTRFLVVEEKNLMLAPFVDIRFAPLAQGQFSVSTKELFALEKMHDIKRPQSVFIFHHAFVCSTLMARCLNQIDAFFSLKEPWVLRRLSDFKRTQGQRLPTKKWGEMFTCYLALLARNYHTGRTPVIKVTNLANNLLTDVLKYLPGQKILYLYSDLQSFLVSNLKKPRDTQIKMPSLAAAFLSDGDFAQRFPHFSDVKRLSFLQVCALIWLVNLYNFRCSTEKVDPSNIKTLNMKNFLTDMGGNLQSLSGFFGHNVTPMEIARMLDPEVTQTDAKHQHLSYGRQSKQAEMTLVLSKYGVEIEKALRWITPLVEELGVLEYCEVNIGYLDSWHTTCTATENKTQNYK